MTFLTFPLLLGGLAAASLPVLLHLMMRGKPKSIEFPALMFVKKRFEIQRRSDRLKHWVLLALRIAAPVLFGFALARPAFQSAERLSGPASGTNDEAPKARSGWGGALTGSLGSRESPIAAALVVDGSFRMDYVFENQTRLDVARSFALWIVEQLPPDSRIAVLTAERESAVFQVDRLAAEERIRRLQSATVSRSLVEAVRDALRLLAESEQEQRELYVLTDLSEPGWPGESAETLRDAVQSLQSPGRRLEAAGKDLGIFVIDVGVIEPTDSAVVRLSPSPQTATSQSSIHLEAELSHLGPATSKTVELLLLESSDASPDGEIVRDSRTVDFPDGESRRFVSFTLEGFEPGIRQGRLRFTVPDALAVDDQRAFTIQVQPPWKVLLLAQTPVRDSSLFLRQALETVPFEVETESLDELRGKTAKELSAFRAVILLDPSPLEPAAWKKLADYADGGGGVGVFLGARADSLPSFNDPAATEILGAKLVRQARDPGGELWMIPENEASPILSPFRPFGSLADFPWEAQRVFRYWETAERATQTEIAMPFSDGRPAVLIRNLGRGRTATVTTPVSERSDAAPLWNLLPRSEAPWMFVLFAEGIAKYLVGAADRNFNFPAGEPIVLRPDVDVMPPTCLLATPSGKSIRLNPDVRQREITVPEAVEPGNYRIRSGGAREALDTGFSVNIAGEEAVLRRVDREKLDRFFGENNYRLARTHREVEQGIARRRVGQELYAAVMLLLVAVFTAEYVFSNRFYAARPVGRRSTPET